MTLLWFTFATGLGLGLAIAMPVGPISLLCIQQALSRGFGAGIAAGLGVALADGAYGAVAAFGLTAVTAFLVDLETPLRVVGLLAMLVLAVRIWRNADAPKHLAPSVRSGAATTVQIFALTIANPMTVVTFLALFVGAGLGLAAGYEYSAALTCGIFAGSFVWWTAVSWVVGVLRERITAQALGWINRVSALILVVFALVVGAGLLQG